MSNEIVGRSLSLIEVDYDAYRITQFEDARAGSSIRNWALNATSTSLSIAGQVAGDVSGYCMQIVRSGAAASSGYVSWSLFPQARQISCYMRARVNNAGSTAFGIQARATLGSVRTGYYMKLVNTGVARIQVAKLVAGVETVLSLVDFSYSTGVFYWVRFDVGDSTTGALLRWKVWTGDLADEPVDFTGSVDDTSSPITNSGSVGVHVSSLASDITVAAFRARSMFSDVLETVRYALPTKDLPFDFHAIPNIKKNGISFTPAVVSLGVDLGQRASLQVTYNDHLASEYGEFYNNGTYWGRFRAKQLFRRKLAMRYRTGLLTQDIDDYTTYNMITESFNGPTLQGDFTLLGQDILKLLDNDRAQAPVLSNGQLLADITAIATTCTLTPSGIGNTEYPSSGIACIGGSEVVTFTRAGDVLTIVRGTNGTTATTHSAEDRVQLCLKYTAATASEIGYDLFVTYGSIDYHIIPIEAWNTEVDTYLGRLYGRLIVEPTGVNQLISELIQQAGLAIWWDSILELIQLRVLRNIDTTAFEYNQTNIVNGSSFVQEQLDKRITAVWNWYGVKNPTQPLDQLNNYRSNATVDDLEEATLNGSPVIKKIFSTWIPAFASTTATRVNDLQIGRYLNPPRLVAFEVQRYSGVPEPVLGGGYHFTYYGSQNELGRAVTIPIQVTKITPSASTLKVDAEEMLFTTFDTADNINRAIIIDGDINDFDLLAVHNSIYPAVTADDVAYGVNLVVTINEGVTVGASLTSTRAFDVGTAWPVGFPITLVVIGRIQGAGGAAQNVTNTGHPVTMPPGLPGGTALYSHFPIIIDNSQGEIFGGAGAGGAGNFTPGAAGYAPGGGGAGTVPGAGGVLTNNPSVVFGLPGTANAGGVGAKSATGGGDGGGPGLPGNAGTAPSGPAPGAGGAAGNAIDGISFCTIPSGLTGDIRGPTIN